MKGLGRFLVMGVTSASLTLVSTPADAQVDLTGAWGGLFHEEQPERAAGAALGEYLGLPINEAARAYADAWSASRATVPEHQCQAHSAPYELRGPMNMRIWDERDPLTQQLVAIHMDVQN